MVLFFTKGAPTRKIWFYQLDLGRNLGKTNSLNDNDLVEFIELQKTFADSGKSWTVDASDVNQTNFDLSVKNPNTPEDAPLKHPQEILAQINLLDEDTRQCPEIPRETGMSAQDVRWVQRFSNYQRALRRLKQAVELATDRELSDLEKQGVIHAFKYTFELAWTTLQDYLKEQGEEIHGPRDAFRLAFNRDIIENGQIMDGHD